MRGLVLAAGAGSRLGSLGEDRPKCLVSVGGKTLLEWQRTALTGAGIQELAIVGGNRAELLPREGWTHFRNPQWAETGVVASMLAARDWLESEDCLVSYADIVYGRETVVALRETPGDIALTSYSGWRELWEARFNDPLSDAESFETDADGRLRDIGSRADSLDHIRGQFMGLVKLTPTGFQLIEQLVQTLGATAPRLDMTGLLRRLVAQNVAVQTREVDGFWFEVDNANDARLFPEWAAKLNWPA